VVKTSELVAGECEFVIADGEKLRLRALSLGDVQRGIEQLQEEMAKSKALRLAIAKLATAKNKPTVDDAFVFVSAALPLATRLTELFGSACGKDGKWLAKRSLNDLLSIITKITELTRPEETLPLFFGLFRMWKKAFQAMQTPATS